MDNLEKDIAILAQQGGLKRTRDDVDAILEQLTAARESIAASEKHSLFFYGILETDQYPDPNSAAITLAKLQNPIKQSFEKAVEDLKKVHTATNKYGKSLNEVGGV